MSKDEDTAHRMSMMPLFRNSGMLPDMPPKLHHLSPVTNPIESDGFKLSIPQGNEKLSNT
jgi:hypothetical protein